MRREQKKKIAETKVPPEPELEQVSIPAESSEPELESPQDEESDSEPTIEEAPQESPDLALEEPTGESAPAELEKTFQTDDVPSVEEEQEELQRKVEALSASTRKILQDDYQATFLGVEKIDEDKLI